MQREEIKEKVKSTLKENEKLKAKEKKVNCIFIFEKFVMP